jgi:hypothetical protein
MKIYARGRTDTLGRKCISPESPRTAALHVRVALLSATTQAVDRPSIPWVPADSHAAIMIRCKDGMSLGPCDPDKVQLRK